MTGRSRVEMGIIRVVAGAIVRDGKVLTRDLGGTASTGDVGNAIAALI